MKSILFVSTANGGRSVMAEALAKKMFGEQTAISSSGIEAGHLHPAAVEVMREINIDISGHEPRQLTADDLKADLVVIVCGRSLPLELKGRSRRVHWPIPDPADPPDPAGPKEPPEATTERFRETRTALSKHLKTLAKQIDSQVGGAGTTARPSLL